MENQINFQYKLTNWGLRLIILLVICSLVFFSVIIHVMSQSLKWCSEYLDAIIKNFQTKYSKLENIIIDKEENIDG